MENLNFISTVLSSVSMNFDIFGVVRDVFFRRYLKQSHRSLQYNENNVGTKFLSPSYSNVWWNLS